MKVQAIINPISGVGSKRKIPKMIEEMCREAGHELNLTFTEYAGHASIVTRQAIDQGADCVIAVGGDGTVNEIARSMVRPVVADEFSRLATALGQAKSDGLKSGLRGLTAFSLKLGAGLDDLHVKCDALEKSLAGDSAAAQIAAMRDLRKTVDRMEGLVDDKRWPLPKYREILFVY